MTLRRTKIIATLGPATDSEEIMTQMLVAGVDLVRLNFSHGSHEQHQQRILLARTCAAKLDRTVGVLADLQGPKIRIARFSAGKIQLKRDDLFTLDADKPDEAGDQQAVGIDYKELPQDVGTGDTLLLDDGRLSFRVLSVVGSKIHCRVVSGGTLSNNKGINRLGGGLSANALTDKDRSDIQAAIDFDVDYIAVSFPRNAHDIQEARAIIAQRDPSIGIIAKIERTEALVHIDDIILASDGVMVARGDLAVEIGDAEVPAVQKQLIKRARALNKPVITATQMMESMVTSKVPTRAEVSDVANAVLDTTDAVMLSAETAVGQHPVLVVDTVARVCVSAERHPHTRTSKHRIECFFERIDEAIAMAAMYTANHMNIRAIIAFTETGTTTVWMSRIRTSIPIYGLSRHARARGKMTLCRDVYPFAFNETPLRHEQINHEAILALQTKGLLSEGDLVILTKGDYAGIHGNTNSMQILQVGALA